ncbi:MAG: GAF domain-containing protein [Janthinobacterium lividum]
MLLATPPCLLPVDEAQRLQSLRAYTLLHAPPERVFAELVALSAHVFGLPVSLLALVEADEVLYKANYGLPGLRGLPRAETFCDLAIRQNKCVVFWDVDQAQHALLTEAAVAAVRARGVRFYAGAPLRLPDAQTVGTLCVVGYEPRPFSAQEQHLLVQLAQVVSLTIAARHTCLTNRGLGWAHWGGLEDQLAEQVLTLSAGVRQLVAPLGCPLLGVPPLVLAQVQQRLHDLAELLQEYQPAGSPQA